MCGRFFSGLQTGVYVDNLGAAVMLVSVKEGAADMLLDVKEGATDTLLSVKGPAVCIMM